MLGWGEWLWLLGKTNCKFIVIGVFGSSFHGTNLTQQSFLTIDVEIGWNFTVFMLDNKMHFAGNSKM